MHELSYKPPEYGLSKRHSTLSFPANREALFSQPEKESRCL